MGFGNEYGKLVDWLRGYDRLLAKITKIVEEPKEELKKREQETKNKFFYSNYLKKCN